MTRTYSYQHEEASSAKQIYQGEDEESIIGTKAQVFLGCGAEADDGKEDGEAPSRNHKDNNIVAAVVVGDAVNRCNCRRHAKRLARASTEAVASSLILPIGRQVAAMIGALRRAF
jgi:hypothetical protein